MLAPMSQYYHYNRHHSNPTTCKCFCRVSCSTIYLIILCLHVHNYPWRLPRGLVLRKAGVGSPELHAPIAAQHTWHYHYSRHHTGLSHHQYWPSSPNDYFINRNLCKTWLSYQLLLKVYVDIVTMIKTLTLDNSHLTTTRQSLTRMLIQLLLFFFWYFLMQKCIQRSSRFSLRSKSMCATCIFCTWCSEVTYTRSWGFNKMPVWQVYNCKALQLCI